VLLFVVAVFNLNVVPSIAANGGVTVWLWIISLLLFFWPQGIAVIELAHRYPGEGGVYLWAKEVFGDFHGFLSGWCYWTNNMLYVPTVMLYFVGVSVYVLGPGHQGLADNKIFASIASLSLLALLTLFNILGLGVGKWINNIGAIGTFVAAAVLIGLGVVIWAHFGSTVSSADFKIPSNPKFVLNSFGVICFGLVGLELGPVMGYEIRDPRRSVPRGVLWGGALAGLIYLSATVALLLSVPQHEVKVVQGVLQGVDKITATGVGARWILTALAIILAVAIAGSTSAWLGGSARIIFVSGIDRYMPKALGKVHPKFATPHVALLTIATLSSLLVSMSFIGATVKEAYVTLLDLSVVLQMISYLYLYAALARVAFSKSAGDGYYSAMRLRLASIGGIAATVTGGTVAFVPSRQIDSIWRFEAKMVGSCVLFLGLAALLFWYYSRRRAA